MGTRTKKTLKVSLALVFALMMLFGFVRMSSIADYYRAARVATIRLTVTPFVNGVVYDGSMTMTLVPRASGGNLQWDNVITIPETNTIDVPRNVDYLFRIEPENKNHFMAPANFDNFTWAGGTKNSDETHWVYEFDFTASSVFGLTGQLTPTISFYDRYFDLQVDNVFSGVDPADIWIGVLDSHDTNAEIAWEPLEVGDNFVKFNNLTRYNESPSETDGRWPAILIPRSFQIFEYAPNYMRPQDNWNANPRLGGLQLPNNVSIPGYALYLKPHGVTFKMSDPTITNVDNPIVISSRVEVLGEISTTAIGGTQVVWNANKVADSVEVDLRAADQKSSEFDVDYTITFNATGYVEIDDLSLVIRDVEVSVTYSGNVATGDNYIFGDFRLSRDSMPLGSVSAIGGDLGINSLLRVFNEIDGATDARIKHLGMSTSITTPLVDAMHQLEFVGYLIYNRTGDPMQRSELPETLPEDGEIEDSGTFVRRVSRTVIIPVDRNNINIVGLSNNFNDLEVDIEDTITVPELAHILKISDLTVNDTDGIGGFTIAEDRRSATISIPGQMPRHVGGSVAIVVRYTVTYEDNSQEDRTSRRYTINNAATALGVDSGTGYGANVEIDVFTTPEFYVTYSPGLQGMWKDEDNTSAEVTFLVYEGALTPLPPLGLKGPPDNPGYTFQGWAKVPSETVTGVDKYVTEDVTYTAIWMLTDYTTTVDNSQDTEGETAASPPVTHSDPDPDPDSKHDTSPNTNHDPDIQPPPVAATVENNNDDDGEEHIPLNDDTTEVGEPETPLTPELPPDPEQPEPLPTPETPTGDKITIKVTATAGSLADGSWALWNLILSIACTVLALLTGIRAVIKKRQEDEEDEQQRETVYAIDEDEEQEWKKRGRLIAVLAVSLLAIAGIVVFMLTQDMKLQMVLIDWWTLAHAILLTSGVLFAYKREKDQDQDSDEEFFSPITIVS